MDTICRDCVFAVWEGNQQIQCKHDRLQKFQDNGTEIVEEEDEKTGKVYMKILGRFCNMCRDRQSVKGIPARKRMKEVRQEVTLPIALAVYMDKDHWPTHALLTLMTMVQQTVKPAEIILIYNVDGEDAPPSYTDWFLENAGGVPWRIENIKGTPVFGQSEDLVKADYGASVDLAVKSKEMTAVYFAVAKAGYEFPLDFIETIDRAINDDMKRFVALLPDEDGNGLFIQTGLHNLLQGNKSVGGCDTIIEKVRAVALEEGNSHMIKRYEELGR